MKKSKLKKKLESIPLKPVNRNKTMGGVKNSNQNPITKNIVRIKEKRWYVNLIHKTIPQIKDVLKKVGVVLLSSFILLMVFNFFSVVELSWLTFVQAICLYFILEEVKSYFTK